jgi:hypothetical protein
MHPVREPRIDPVPLAELRPTQITVGMREVALKRASWREYTEKKGAEFLGRHMIPVVRGPKSRLHIIDHHHLALALMQEGVEAVMVMIVSDLSTLEPDAFWIFLDNRGWMHPFDTEGKRRGYKDIPKSVRHLKDDPYRSLAGELRRRGGFSKDTTPFSEFLWADFLRRRLKREFVNKNFERALKDALRLAKSTDANFLPGWCGPVSND